MKMRSRFHRPHFEFSGDANAILVFLTALFLVFAAAALVSYLAPSA